MSKQLPVISKSCKSIFQKNGKIFFYKLSLVFDFRNQLWVDWEVWLSGIGCQLWTR